MANIKKYNGSTWETTTARKYETKSEIIVPPTTIYADGSNITTYTIKGNTVQNGTPTPSAPVDVVGVGELDSGQYKIPILTAQGSAVNYLGSVQSTRQIKKVVLTGNESDITYESGNAPFKIPISPPLKYIDNNAILWLCSHYRSVPNSASWSSYDQLISWSAVDLASQSGKIGAVRIRDTSISTLEDFKTFLSTQYAAGTPVTFWYVLKDEQTGTVNEPLMKIGDYSDSISNAAQIPTTEGANSITVDTTVQPSEFTATWTGWHDASVKEWDGSDWQ